LHDALSNKYNLSIRILPVAGLLTRVADFCE
jgi:hypothetical protein